MTPGLRVSLLRLALCALAAAALAVAGSKDADQDGLKDSLEQDLLEKFRPQFMIASGDCEAGPAEFQAGSRDPKAVAANGTIYGQVFRVSAPAHGSGEFVEIHYFHLWARDCGLFGHLLDVEHVSVLTRAEKAKDGAKKYRATHWYAAAHENTMCDGGHGVRAASMGNEDSGLRVWVSKGKHGSFLAPERCGRGCGGDVCDPVRVMPAGKLINIGEFGRPLNGAVWVDSKRWRFADKMESDFSPAVLAELNKPGVDGVVSLSAGRRAVQAVVAASNSTRGAMADAKDRTAGAVTVAAAKTDGALTKASANTGESLGKSARSVRDSLKKARQRVRDWFEGRKSADGGASGTASAPKGMD